MNGSHFIHYSISHLLSEYRSKNLSEESYDGDQLDYTQTKIFFYDQNTSNDSVSDSDILCTINIPLVVRSDS